MRHSPNWRDFFFLLCFYVPCFIDPKKKKKKDCWTFMLLQENWGFSVPFSKHLLCVTRKKKKSISCFCHIVWQRPIYYRGCVDGCMGIFFYFLMQVKNNLFIFLTAKKRTGDWRKHDRGKINFDFEIVNNYKPFIEYSVVLFSFSPPSSSPFCLSTCCSCSTTTTTTTTTITTTSCPWLILCLECLQSL